MQQIIEQFEFDWHQLLISVEIKKVVWSFLLPSLNYLIKVIPELKFNGTVKARRLFQMVVCFKCIKVSCPLIPQYQTLVNDGRYSPLTTIRYVTDKNNKVRSKNNIETIQLLETESTSQVQSTMQGVVEKGEYQVDPIIPYNSIFRKLLSWF